MGVYLCFAFELVVTTLTGRKNKYIKNNKLKIFLNHFPDPSGNPILSFPAHGSIYEQRNVSRLSSLIQSIRVKRLVCLTVPCK